MNNVKKGDIVARKSHNKDVVFVVDLIIENKIAILTGITTRLKADSPIEDLEIVDKKEVINIYKSIDEKIDKTLCNKEIIKNNFLKRSDKIIYTGRILHLDGDKRYSEKSNMYYKKMGLTAIVKNISESKQVVMANELISRYNPDIVVITGHDRYDKVGKKLWRYI